jgi:glycosyltransferase involved in cell wall biosynthesis
LPSVDVKIILVNDGSTSGISKNQINWLQGEIPALQYLLSEPNKGKGDALRKGVEISKSDHIIVTDVDFPYQLDSLVRVYHELINGSNVVLGYRKNDYYKNTPPLRTSISKWFRKFLKRIFQLKTTDTQCGLKGFDKTGREFFLQTTINRFLFDLEFVLLISKDKTLKVNSVDVQLKEGIVFSRMKFGILITEMVNLLILIFRRR